MSQPTPVPIETRIATEASSREKLSNWHYRGKQCLTIIAILMTITATINAFSGWLTGIPAAVIAAIPGCILFYEQAMKHNALAGWNWEFHLRMTEILNATLYRNLSDVDASKMYDDTRREMFAKRPELGSDYTMPKS